MIISTKLSSLVVTKYISYFKITIFRKRVINPKPTKLSLNGEFAHPF